MPLVNSTPYASIADDKASRLHYTRLMQDRKTVLDLPARLVFSEKGRKVFMAEGRIPASLAPLGANSRDSGTGYGVLLDTLVPASIQRFLISGYISRLELYRNEFSTCRLELIDLSKLMVYGMFYRQCDAVLFSRILASAPIKRWNISSPAYAIDGNSRLNEKYLKSFIVGNDAKIVEIRDDLLAPFRSSIRGNSNLSSDEIRIQLLLCEKYLQKLRPIIWFLLTKFHGAEGYEALGRAVRLTIAEYMDKSRIAEYAALMIAELAIHAGKRERLRGERFVLSWDTGDGYPSATEAGYLGMTLRAERSEPEGMTEISLFDFYHDSSIRPNQADKGSDAQLGPYYLGHLNEVCAKVGVGFETSVRVCESTDASAVSLSFRL